MDEAAEPKVDPALDAERAANNFFESDTESRTTALAQQDHLVAQRIEQVLSNYVDIGGYFRAGYGRSGKGGPLEAFKAPGAAAKYRLGNEAENYGELILGKNIYLPGAFHVDDGLHAHGGQSPVARVQLRINFFNPYSAHSSGASTTVGLPEAWAAIGGILRHQPDAKFWAGVRFYRRHDIHIDDFFFWDMSGGGGGVEDIKIGPGKMALAWIGLASTSGLSYLPQPDPNNKAGFSKSNIDLRFYDLPLLGGLGELGLIYAHEQAGEDQSGREGGSTHGVSFNFVHTVSNFLSDDGVQKLSLQYGTGAAKTFTSGFETLTLPEGVFIRPDYTGAWRVRFTESFSANLHQHFSLGPVVIVQATDYGDGTGRQVWVSGGARPIVHFDQHFSLAVEGGLDWVKDDEANTAGLLSKLTIAPQVSIGGRFSSRPVIRAFATMATWSEDFVGQIGQFDYVNSNKGMNYGMQMEAWW